MRLVFVRHGEPDYAHDVLTETGRLQAKATAERLKDECIKAIYSSPLGRASETASYTAKQYGLPVQLLDFMPEINWGNPEGDEVLKEGHPWTLGDKMVTEPDSVNNLFHWREHPYFKDNLCLEYYDKIAKGIDETVLKPLGFERRGDRYFCTRHNTDTVALFSHGGSGGCALAHVLNLSFAYVVSVMPYGFCSIAVVRFPATEGSFIVPKLELFNDMNHVPGVGEAAYRYER